MLQEIAKKSRNLIFSILRLILVTILTVILIFAIPGLSISTIIVFAPHRALAALLARIFRSDLDSFVMNEHASFTIKNSGLATSNIMVIGIIEGEHSIEHHRKLFQERILNLREDDGSKDLVYEKLTKTWESFFGYAFWKIDRNFDLTKHMRDYDHRGTLALPTPCAEADLNNVAGKLINAPWDRNRSPWEVLLIGNFRSGQDNFEDGDNHQERNQTAVIIRADHVLGDGYSFVEFMRIYLQTTLEMPTLKLGDTSRFSFWKKLGMFLSIPYHTADNALYGLTGSKLQYLKKLDKEVTMVVASPPVDVEVVKKIKDHFKVSYATVIYAAIFGAIHRALENSGQEFPDKLVSVFVVPKPNHPKGLTIHAAFVLAEWPLKCASREERLRKIQKNFASLSRSTAVVSFMLAANVMAYAPIITRRILANIATRSGISLGCTNFPVTKNAHYFEGHRITNMSAFVGTTHSTGLITVIGGISNRQQFNFSVHNNMFASDEDVQKLGIYAVEELKYLLEHTV